MNIGLCSTQSVRYSHARSTHADVRAEEEEDEEEEEQEEEEEEEGGKSMTFRVFVHLLSLTTI